MDAVTRHRAVLDRQTDAWIVTFPDLAGCHTYGRTLRAAKRNALDVCALWLDVPEAQIELDFDVKLPRGAKTQVQRAVKARREAETLKHEAQVETEQAARSLVDGIGLSIRDAAELLGVSPARVGQLVKP
ncbi:MAG: hypothetical protein IT198_14905 [Acidimicrobiia bacterium]|nr:hypothetical protein [Acidimicrobiia bacterium]